MKYKIVLLVLVNTLHAMDIELSNLSEKISILRFVPDNNTKENPLYLKNSTHKIMAVSMKALSLDNENRFHEAKSTAMILPGQIACIKQWIKEDCEKFFIWDEDGILLNVNDYDHCVQNEDGISVYFKAKDYIRIKNPGVYALREKDEHFIVEPINIDIKMTKKNPTNTWYKWFASCLSKNK